MFQTGLTGQLLFLIVISFSLLIVALNLCFNRDAPVLRLMGLLFWIPLSVFIFLYLTPLQSVSPSLFIWSEILLLIGLFIILLFQDRILNTGAMEIAVMLIPPIFIGISFIPVMAPYLLAATRTLVYCCIVILLLVLYQANRKYKTAYYLLSGLIFMLIAQFVALLQDTVASRITYLLVQGLAYGMLFWFFYQEIHKAIMNRINEVNRRLLEWEKSVKYEVLKRTIDFEHAHQKLLDINKLDGLTKCYTKTAILDIIEKLMQANPTQNFTILMLDIDKFKDINDTMGHLIGDQILVQVANIIQNSIRSVDSPGRYGGDEFIVTLPRTGVRDALYVAERIRKKVAEDPEMEITLSIGLAAFPQDGTTPEALIAMADKGLYLSKQRGRNTVSYAAELQ